MADAQREQGVGVAPLAAVPALGKLLKTCICLSGARRRQVWLLR